MYRFLKRVWVFVHRNSVSESQKNAKLKNKNEKPQSQIKNEQRSVKELEKIRHRTIKKVTEDIESFRFNTAISALMEYLNGMTKTQIPISNTHIETMLVLVAPFAPHIAEELWREGLGNNESVLTQKWPGYDEKMLLEKEVRIVVQVNGKVRDTILFPAGVSEREVTAKAMESENVKRHLGDKAAKRVIFVPDKLMNIVV